MSQRHPLAPAVEHPSPAKHRLAPWRTIAGIALAPSAFVLQVTASYVVAALGCSASHAPANWLIGINVFALGMTVTGIVIAANNFQSRRPSGQSARWLNNVGTKPVYANYGMFDQQLAGLLMWVPAGVIYLAATLFAIARLTRQQSFSAKARVPN